MRTALERFQGGRARSDPGPTRAVREATDWLLRLFDRAPASGAAVVLALLLGVIWLAEYGSGGTKAGWDHLFYIPIILATESVKSSETVRRSGAL
jgi:hypothetical protein